MFTLPLIATFFAALLLVLRFFENTKAYQGLLVMPIMLVLEVYVAQLMAYHLEMVANDTPELDFPDQGGIQTFVPVNFKEFEVLEDSISFFDNLNGKSFESNQS